MNKTIIKIFNYKKIQIQLLKVDFKHKSEFRIIEFNRSKFKIIGKCVKFSIAKNVYNDRKSAYKNRIIRGL